MALESKVSLSPTQFGERERPLIEHGPLAASGFLFEGGVAAVRLSNDLGELVMLPFQGQQIWSAHFHGRELTMKSMFDRPRATRDYLCNYGGFLLHCGAATMGVPGKEDSHPLHGELPNAPFQQAWLIVGEDEGGPYLGLGGMYQHTVAFGLNYQAMPLVKLHAGSALVDISLVVRNLKRTEMDLMYLAHINFRPVNDGRIVYSAEATPEHVRVRKSIPSHVRPGLGYREFLEDLGRDPAAHHILRPDLVFDPEVVIIIDYLADEQGWAHSLQMHPDGSADYVRHQPRQLEKGVRWICRTPDQDALGLVLPATAEPEGYSAEKAKGNVKTLAGGAEVRFDMQVGALTAGEAERVENTIERILRR